MPWCGVVQYVMVWSGAELGGVAWPGMAWFSMVLHVVWRGVVCSLVWCGVVWWCGMT